MSVIIDDAGENDYSLLVTESGNVEARKRIPYNGVRYYTTASRGLPTGRRTKSQYALSVDDVIDKFLARSGTDLDRPTLAEQVAQALREVHEDREPEVGR
jgi:hypothetical protein